MIAAIIAIVLGGVGTALVIGWFDQGGRMPVLFLASPVLVVFGIVLLVNSFRPFAMRIDERGILLKHSAKKVRVALGWQYIAHVSVEELPKPKGEKGTATYLTVWPHGGANPGVPQDWVIQRNGWVGYRLIDVEDIREDKEQLSAALSRYAAPIFR
ncbi:hypothetical protein F1721_20950 [Saccharopolyspora hirsuta]|uniref:PH domain-containing protein n=1 Tax=Saccharopolyspora hirsuta TaxID=1837 RepID=A0A5M7BY23_SACHI|nr:hypothetical protein [Saccharopolyspora hirsuta]KAA5831215.1 hypothetical protein F1721_20950 [Saccharopolyspora hirsuta]